MKSFLLILGLFALMTQVFGFTCDPQACMNGQCSNVGNGNSYCSCSGGYYGKNCDIAPQPCDASQGSCSSPANLNLVAHPTTCLNFVVSNIPDPRPASTTLTIELFLRQNLPRNQAYTISQGTGGGTYVTYDVILPSLNTTQPNLFNGVLITDQISDPYSFEIDRDVVGPVPRIRALYPLSALAVNGMLSICAYDYSYGEADTVFLDGATLHYYNLFDPCQSNPCLNGGVCVSNGASFTCDCSASGFSGNLCQGCLLLPNIGTFINSQTGGQAVVILSTQPTSTVTVYLEAECATLSKCSLTFTPQNWNSPQVITAFPSTNSTNDSGCRLRGKISSSDICDGDTSENFALVINEQMSSYYSRPPNSVAVSSGDPHFDTFDHVHHDFYDVGDFYFVRQLNGDFAIQTRQKPCNNVACNAAVAVKYKTAVFLLAIVDGAPSISSGNLLAEDVKVTGSDNTYTLKTPEGISVQMEVRYWFGTQYYMNIYVTAPESFHYQLVGLAGFYDGDRSNDLMMPDGQVTTVVNDFQQSWRVASAEDLFIDPSATIPALTSIFPTPAPTDAPTTAPTGPKGKTCTIPGADDVISKLPNTPPVSPVANETVPNNPDFEPPTCDFTDAQLEAAAKADCGAYFNDTVAQCCVSLGVNGDEQYAACLCDYKFAGNGDFIMDSVSPFYALCQQKATALNTTCDPCPRACSGHGTCGAGGICTCTTGFHGDDCGEDWSVPPTVATASPSSTSTCAVGAIVTVTGNNFFGTTGLTCLFNDVTTVAATKLTTFQVSCPLPSPRPLGAMTVKVSRDGMTSATGASFTLVESCCESPCAHGTCGNAANGGFTCDCTGTIYSGSRCETAPGNCPAESLNGVNWPSTAASASAIAPCPSGFTGSLSRDCQATGTWDSVVDTCTSNPPCPAAADYAHASWPETQPGQAASGTCLTGYANGAAGAPRRQCPPNGVQFSSLVVNHCVRLQCPTVIEGGYTWNKTDSLLFIKLSCSLGQTGGPSRTCQGDGTWGPISGSCFTAATVCPVNSYSLAAWPETPVGTVATGTCNAGYFGSPQRQCKQDGTWSSTLLSFCQRRTCPSVSEGNAQWNVTNSLTTFYAKCDANYFGSPSRLCQADGTWGPITNPCALVAGTCPGQTYNRATWGATAAGATAFGTCIAGYTGTPNRICKADGTWQDLVRNLCTKI